MTESVSLALIALVGMLLFSMMAIILVSVILKTKPSHLQFITEFGSLNVKYDTKVDE